MPGQKGGRPECPEGVHFVTLTELGKAKGGYILASASSAEPLTPTESQRPRPFQLWVGPVTTAATSPNASTISRRRSNRHRHSQYLQK
ncbi:hypothetical protein JG688_00013961 [Phytophthora aleatoria]|uniref:Uncharacterized protein n=1 Tax=Phytophthora aleatoria TaxID=2496075 RepID=A0A8J5I8N4_9STRA|nr:hypothetical protein JG688_00013961 [Phytophthora aleatoria]